MIKITYVYHSCFVIELEKAVFVFDYYRGQLPPIPKGKSLFVFASHIHFDHYTDDIFKFGELSDHIVYVLSNDIPEKVIEKANKQGISKKQIHFVGPNVKVEIEDCTIKTLKSTDEGVAFLLQYKGVTIYHAGDLNWWHWESESQVYNEMMKRKYQYEISKIEAENIDIAFVPLDPRLEGAYHYGMDYFMEHTNTHIVFPMHFGRKYNVCKRLLKEDTAKNYITRVKMITNVGEMWEVN